MFKKVDSTRKRGVHKEWIGHQSVCLVPVNSVVICVVEATAQHDPAP